MIVEVNEMGEVVVRDLASGAFERVSDADGALAAALDGRAREVRDGLNVVSHSVHGS